MNRIDDNENNAERVAIVGMAGRFPGAGSVQRLWENLIAGTQSIRRFTDEELDACVARELRANPDYIPARGVLDDVDKFDSAFFGYSPIEAAVMDPQQRVFCEIAWAALEDAGCVPGSCSDLIGVFAGAGPNTYFFHHVSPRPELMRRLGDFAALLLNEKDFLGTRVSYKLNLRGASYTLGCGCSTSLAAVFEAYQHLMTYRCDVAIAGGVEITTPQNIGYLWHEGSIFSRTGSCRPFDIRSDGMVPGSGGAAVVLKRLSDATAAGDRIYAVIRGAAMNNDGAAKVGFTSPSVEGQVAAIAMAQGQAGVDPSSIGFVEAHGTGTQLGDPIEVEALRQVFEGQPPHRCAIGSIKSNIGHLGIAAGVAGVIKATLALHHELIPPTAQFTEPNPRLGLDQGPFYVNVKPVPFPSHGEPRRAGVSALGLGGTNVHLVLEEAPPAVPSQGARRQQLLLLSARDQSALRRSHEQLADYLAANPGCQVSDVAATLGHGRTTFAVRNAIVCDSTEGALARLREASAKLAGQLSFPATSNWPVVFVFPGQGAQYAGMGETLYRTESVYREAIDRCAQALVPRLGCDIRDLLFAPAGSEASANDLLKETRYTQPAMFSTCYALAQLWLTWGVAPRAFVGHSIGEYVAACLSGVFSLDDALHLVAERGRLVQSMPPGSMLSVGMSAPQLEPRLPSGVSIAAFNTQSMVVVSGATNVLEGLAAELQRDGVPAKLLVTSHAFHSESMADAAVAFREIVAAVRRSPPKIPFVSTLTGTWITNEAAQDPDHWAQHIRKPVRFSQAIQTLWTKDSPILLEVGPKATTTSLAQRHVVDRGRQVAIASFGKPNQDEMEALLEAAGRLWQLGVSIDLGRMQPRQGRRVLSLPTYPFERTTHWVDPVRCDFQGNPNEPLAERSSGSEIVAAQPQAPEPPSPEITAQLTPEEKFLIAVWKDVLGVSSLGPDDDFFQLGGHSLVGIQLLARIKARYSVDFALRTLLECPTIRLMAHQIRQRATSSPVVDGATKEARDAEEWSPLTLLAPGSTGPTIYCAGGIGGTVMELNSVAKCLGPDIAFYGLETRGVAGHVPLEDIGEMASDHIRAIKRHQSKGPYFVAGYSAGGTVAFEIAKQMRAGGDEVALLVLLDAGSPTLRRRTRLELRTVQFKRVVRNPARELGDIWRRQRRRFFRDPNPHPYAHIVVATERAFACYHPTPYDGDAVLFRTYKDDYIGDIVWTLDEYEGWRDLIRGNITVHPVPGVHLTVCQDPANAKALGTAIRESIEAFLGGRSDQLEKQRVARRETVAEDQQRRSTGVAEQRSEAEPTRPNDDTKTRVRTTVKA